MMQQVEKKKEREQRKNVEKLELQTQMVGRERDRQSKKERVQQRKNY
jgi:hypothetical protein